MSLLHTALQTVLACPACRGTLQVEGDATRVRCVSCRCVYPIIQDIPVLISHGLPVQEGERNFRDAQATAQVASDRRALLDVVAQHHGLSIMRRRAEQFRRRFSPHEWVLDIGVGYGWHWAWNHGGACVIGIDLSLGNLMLARTLLGSQAQRVVLVCADAAALPLREHVISGVWSVQTFQHIPQTIFPIIQVELDRVVRSLFAMEFHNLNPAILHKAVYRLFGKRLHCRGSIGHMEVNRLTAREWRERWQSFRHGHAKIRCGYSELFFHPDFRVRPSKYPVRLEEILTTYAPAFSALFARQVQLQIESDTN